MEGEESEGGDKPRPHPGCPEDTFSSPGEEEVSLVPEREEDVADVVLRVPVPALTNRRTNGQFSLRETRPLQTQLSDWPATRTLPSSHLLVAMTTWMWSRSSAGRSSNSRRKDTWKRERKREIPTWNHRDKFWQLIGVQG